VAAGGERPRRAQDKAFLLTILNRFTRIARQRGDSDRAEPNRLARPSRTTPKLRASVTPTHGTNLGAYR
jgi:hypothetical protein